LQGVVADTKCTGDILINNCVEIYKVEASLLDIVCSCVMLESDVTIEGEMNKGKIYLTYIVYTI